MLRSDSRSHACGNAEINVIKIKQDTLEEDREYRELRTWGPDWSFVHQPRNACDCGVRRAAVARRPLKVPALCRRCTLSATQSKDATATTVIETLEVPETLSQEACNFVPLADMLSSCIGATLVRALPVDAEGIEKSLFPENTASDIQLPRHAVIAEQKESDFRPV